VFFCLVGLAASQISPMVLSVNVLNQLENIIQTRVILADAQSQSIALVVEFSDGGPFRPARVFSSSGQVSFVPGGFAISGLASDPIGTAHLLSWYCSADMGPRVSNIQLRFTPLSSQGSGLPFVLSVTAQPNIAGITARNIHFHMLDIGGWNSEKTTMALQHDAIAIDPAAAGVTVDIVRKIQAGMDPNDHADDVLVFGIMYVCQDLRTRNISDNQLLSDSRFTLNGNGPRIDPRTDLSAPLQGMMLLYCG